MSRVGRAFAFARRIPPRQLAARALLSARRRLASRFPPDLRDAAPPLRSERPGPVFPPRTGLAERAGQGWRFTFIGRSVEMGSTIHWAAPADQLWRMNLHYMEYLEELPDDDALALAQQWIAANPPFAPGSWNDGWNSYALSLRTVVWMQRFRDMPADIALSLARQIRFLARFLETDIGGNHLIKNLKALIWAGAIFEGAEAEEWRMTGLGMLKRELDRQVLPDGTHYERSPSYHAQVLADLIEVRHALGGDPLGGRLDATIAAMRGAAGVLAHPDGGPALFNDAGLTMAYVPVVVGATAPPPIAVLRDAGYFRAALGRFVLIGDLGAIGPDSLPAHAHADVGTFELSVDGLRMIVDQGVFEYVAGPRRAASRATANHNGLCVEGRDLAEVYGAFRCGRRPKVILDRVAESADALTISGVHDGYGQPVRRTFVVDAGAIRIDDAMVRSCAAKLGLLLHPDCAVAVEGATATASRGDTLIEITALDPWVVEDAVWWPDMGVQLATKRLRLTVAPARSESRLVIRAVPFRASEQP